MNCTSQRLIEGTAAPKRVLGHRGTNVKDLHYLIKRLGLPDQYNTVEPHSFTSLNGKVFTIGDTLVVQKYLTENNIDAYNTEVNKTPSPPDPDALVPDAHAPAPLDGRQQVFKATDVANSRATNDYVKVLQRLLPGTEDETYSVLGRDGFVIKVSPKVLLHPAQALELKFASPFDDFKDPVPAMVLKPTEVEVNPELRTKNILLKNASPCYCK